MQHLVMRANELRTYHFDQNPIINARRMLAILVEQGIPEEEARQRIDSHPQLRGDFGTREG